MQLTPFCLMLTCLRVSPDRSQFFRYESILLTCEDQSNSTGWKVKRKTAEGGVRPCSSNWGSTILDSTCTIRNTYPTDSGVYWCESEDGEKKSNMVNITITDRPVILKSPALPVLEGSAVTLRCNTETNSSNCTYYYRKDGLYIGSSSTGELTIRRASKTDEGLYTCSIAGRGESLGSWVAVDASLQASPSPPSAASRSVSASRLLCHMLVGTPFLLSTILLGLIYRDRKRAAQTVAGRRGGGDIIMEIAVETQSGHNDPESVSLHHRMS